MSMIRIFAAAVAFHALFATVHAVNQRTKMKKGEPGFLEMFRPPTMLILSSPMERKVSYTQIKNFKSVGGTVLPLIDAGLVAPYGVAWDSSRSALYVADAALRKIFRVKLTAYKCRRQCRGMDFQLKITGNRYTVVEGVISQWVSVDAAGDLFYSDQETNSVNKLPKATIDKIIKDKILPKDLTVTTESELEGEEAVVEAIHPMNDENVSSRQVIEPQPKPPQIFQLYAQGASPNVGTPAGIVSEGDKLYWSNQVGGFSKGSIAEGSTAPKLKQPAEGDDAPTFPSFKIANNTGSAYGVALTTSKILFTDTGHMVWAASRGNGEVVALTKSMLKPRGIVWDGDNTAYVADEEGNAVSSIPIGLLKEGAPVSHTVDIHAPFGLALVNSDDPMWDQFKDDSGARQVTGSMALLACLSLFMGL